MKWNNFFKKLSYLLLAVILFKPCGITLAQNIERFVFPGSGTCEDPFLIEDARALKAFRDQVNAGESFENCWFYQTENIDLKGEIWQPIGVYDSGCYFEGVYNGGGHYIENLLIVPEAGTKNNSGFFGVLGGTVLNLGIESGSIYGSCVGSIASHSMSGSRPYIINCYSRAELIGSRTGGIADNFSGGVIINSWFDHQKGSLHGRQKGDIVSYDGVIVECYEDGDSFGRKIGGKVWAEAENITIEEQQADRSVLYACSRVDIDMLIPWEWNGTTLVFARQPLDGKVMEFEGEGTRKSPYLIQSYDDLTLFRDLVNTGYSFENTWFRQTADIEIETDDWTPIGLYDSDNYFSGVYDGNGKCIEGLSIQNHEAGELDNAGLFGKLNGVVANLMIKDASVEGECCGIVASSSVGNKRTMAIINCFVQGTICANRPGGIVDSFDQGLIAGCISDVEMSFKNQDKWDEASLKAAQNTSMGGITARSMDTKVYGCYTTAHQVMPEAVRSATSSTISTETLQSDAFLWKQNLKIGLIQQLFGNEYRVDLLEWVSLEPGMETMGGNRCIQIVAILNEYLPIAGLLLAITVMALLKRKKLWKETYQIAAAIISGIVAVFVDCAALGSARESITIGRVIFIVLVNAFFFVELYAVGRRYWRDLCSVRINWALLVAMVGLLALELAQFTTVPRYDAALYYGSFARGSKLFRLDLLTYIGAFVCWKWAQGTALLLAPFEFLMPGQMIGVYISNIIITEVTLVLTYRLIRETIPSLSKPAAIFSSLILLLCPFQLGMFTYLCFDTHCVYYLIWMIYSYKRKNDLMVSFCGFLLFFSKLSGGVFYTIFLIVATVYEVLTKYKGPISRRIVKWWKWSRSLLWMLPAFMYLPTMRWGEWLTIQHFSGASVSPSAASKEMISLLNTLVQSFVFGFRWLFVLLIILMIGVLLVRRLKRGHNPLRGSNVYSQEVLSQEGVGIMLATAAGGLAVVVMLLLYNSDAECPRYTAPTNVMYALLVPVAICVLCEKRRMRTIMTGLIAVLLLIQTYWSIDPAITQTRTSIDTGTNQLYRLALEGDSREDMNLGADYSRGYGSVGDIYAYNIEYNYYDGLIQEVLSEIEPDQDDRFYVLDVIDYELHLHGMQYYIYWNTEIKHSTYDGDDPHSIILSHRSVSTEEIVKSAAPQNSLGKDFYLIVPARVDSDAALSTLKEGGFRILEEYGPQNIYGSMRVYHLVYDLNPLKGGI